ncbi:hypothetical protein Pan181_41460 [Aeoliella mucimassa]|uniref:Uncharacterized protein n=1 Tax=Aeoliella mucimassa TaxID=2527972 RepID=A0A518AT72_9BACT|nr:hypothetical protein Pan181_41460 [Aeoliella mucimassa]
MGIDASQKPLDFESRKRERYVMLESALRISGASAKVWALIRTIESVCGSTGKPLRWSYQTIAEKHGYSRSTAKRAVADAIKSGLVTLTTGTNYNGSQAANELSIDWNAVRHLAINRSAEYSHQREYNRTTSTPVKAPDHSDHPPGQLDPPGGQIDPTPRVNLTLPPGQIDPPYIGIDTKETSTTTADDWEEVEGEVFKAGVNDASRCTADARSNGSPPSQVREVLAWWKEHRGGFDHPEAALYNRIRRCEPSTDADQGWPSWRDGYTPPEVERSKQEEARWRMLHQKWGPVIEGWDKREKRRWAERVVADHPEHKGDGKQIYRSIVQILESDSDYSPVPQTVEI